LASSSGRKPDWSNLDELDYDYRQRDTRLADFNGTLPE
jgi:hypothetical protein